MRAQAFILEKFAHESARGRTDDHRVGNGNLLKPCCEVGGYPDCSRLLRGTLADDVADDDWAGGDANADPRRHRITAGRCHCTDAVDNAKPGADGSFGIVLMTVWPAEIGQHA